MMSNSRMYGYTLHTPDSSDSSDDQLIVEYLLYRKNKTFKPRINHFLWEDLDFVARFRMSKDTVRQLVSLVASNIISATNKNHAVSPVDQVLITLSFYATGSIQRCTGDLSGVHKSTVSRIVNRVSRAIAALCPIYIHPPESSAEIEQCVKEFYDIAKFPNTIGAIACTHVGILSPGGENAEYYRNRKNYFSMNVQAVVDATMKFTNIVARWPGSTHNNTIFSNSRLKGQLDDGKFNGKYLIGDRGYPLKPYLLTPLTSPISEAEKLYNESQIRTRNVVERAFGVWKRRFPAVGMKLRVNIDRVEAIIVATAVLHNICRVNKDTEPPDFETILVEIDSKFVARAKDANSTRRGLINGHFVQLLHEP